MLDAMMRESSFDAKNSTFVSYREVMTGRLLRVQQSGPGGLHRLSILKTPKTHAKNMFIDLPNLGTMTAISQDAVTAFTYSNDEEADNFIRILFATEEFATTIDTAIQDIADQSSAPILRQFYERCEGGMPLGEDPNALRKAGLEAGCRESVEWRSKDTFIDLEEYVTVCGLASIQESEWQARDKGRHFDVIVRIIKFPTGGDRISRADVECSGDAPHLKLGDRIKLNLNPDIDSRPDDRIIENRNVSMLRSLADVSGVLKSRRDSTFQ